MNIGDGLILFFGFLMIVVSITEIVHMVKTDDPELNHFFGED